MEDIYQITKRCENDARTVHWRAKKIDHSSSAWLVTFQKGKELFPKVSHLGVHIIYISYIFTKMLWFFVWFLYFPQPLWVYYICNFLHICIYLYSLFCVLNVQKLSNRCNFLLKVIKIIPTNQLMLYLVCHFNYKIRNEIGKTTFSTQRDTSVPWKSG